ncbi:MAG TPA: RAMP superfamily CRISPR-associated protein [Roseiflexaceae bacterium]|nr:RAMP superfamily CRISPR-associated protein [Roseiflexaceae bacterium]
MPEYYLTIALHSDATFGRGEGVAGLVDVEIEHDADGLPFVGGRALKGLLVEEWANLRFALYGQTDARQPLDAVATQLFGTSGATERGAAEMRVGPAELPADLRATIRRAKLPAAAVLASLTDIRRQTSLDAQDGAPEAASLRAMRVLLRGTPLIARLDFEQEPDERALALLAACALAVRRGGTARNRGRGRLSLLLHREPTAAYDDATFTKGCFDRFAAEVGA